MRSVCRVLAILATLALYENSAEAASSSTTYTTQGDLVITTTSDGRSRVVEERSRSGLFHERLWIGAEGQRILQESLTSIDPFGSAELHQTSEGRERTISWQVGENGHLMTVQGISSAVFYKYDASGRCTAKHTSGNRNIEYKWDDLDRLAEMYSPDGSVDYLFSYDNKNRICSIYDAVTGHTVTRTFDGHDRLTSDGEDGATVRVTYDNAGLIEKLGLPDGSALRYHSDGLIQRVGSDLLWDVQHPGHQCQETLENQEVLWHNDPLGSWGSFFEYDELNQLQSESGEWNQTYGFDPFGQSAQAASGAYDDDGNLCQFQGKDNSWSYTYDALGRLSSASCADRQEAYRYDGFGRLVEIVSNGLSKRLCWFDEKDIGTMVDNKVVELLAPSSDGRRPMVVETEGKVFSVIADNHGSIIALLDVDSGEPVEVYRYSAFGHIHAYGRSEQEPLEKPSCPWLYCGKRWLAMAQAYDFGARRYLLQTLRWAERDPLGLVDTPDDRVYVRNNPVAFDDPAGLFPKLMSWSDLADSVSMAVHTVSENMYKSLTFAKQRLDWLLDVRSTYEDLFFELLGQNWVRLIGYNPDPSDRGTYGGPDTNLKIRITLINGILNGAPEAEENAVMVSSTHGNIPVHFIYAATEGFASDIVWACFAKAGVVSRQAKMLASLWKELIQEMGGPEGGGVILHYAHSLGATDTLNALQRLEPAERQCIRIATFGASTLIEDGVCAQVDNYVSLKDGVPVLDLSRYYKGGTNIHFIPSDIAFPLDHPFCGKTYRTIIEMLGQKIQEEFLLSQSRTSST